MSDHEGEAAAPQRTVTVDGVALHVVREGRGVPVVALHGGMGLSHDYLRRGLRPLVERGAELVLFDQRGNGRSRPADLTDVTMATWADDVAAVLDDLALPRAVVFGHSYGGFIALHTALRHPDRVAGLVLCATGAAMDWEAIHAAISARQPSQAQLRGFADPPFGSDDEYLAWLQVALPLYLAPVARSILRWSPKASRSTRPPSGEGVSCSGATTCAGVWARSPRLRWCSEVGTIR